MPVDWIEVGPYIVAFAVNKDGRWKTEYLLGTPAGWVDLGALKLYPAKMTKTACYHLIRRLFRLYGCKGKGIQWDDEKKAIIISLLLGGYGAKGTQRDQT